jgi:methionine-rich copper-binding protein CopC
MRGRAILAAVAVAAACGAMAATASAHVEVKSTSPKRGGSASTSLGTVTVTFTGPLRRGTVRVTGPGGRVVSNGSGGRDPRSISRLRVGLRGGKSAGRYRVRWTIVAADGHEQSGSFRFRLRR